LSDAEASYYLGDLLLHVNRGDEAERYFKQAIALDPNLTPAYASLGQLCVWQKRYAEAKKYLERGTTSSQNYLVHYQYAWLLTREILAPARRIDSPETAAVIREELSRAIKLARDFAPSYYLFALLRWRKKLTISRRTRRTTHCC
jgi:tetratricopeptide (TPR) repeat protein